MWISYYLHTSPEVELNGYMIVLFLSFLATPVMSSMISVLVYISANGVQDSLFSESLWTSIFLIIAVITA